MHSCLAAPYCAAVAVASLLGAACNSGNGISGQIESQFKASTTAPIDLALVGPASWERVCVLGPYTDNERTEQLLGFKWDAQAKTSIATNDGITVLVFVQGKKVLAYAEHPRSQGDLSQLQPRCLPRSRATVVRQVGKGGWVSLVAAP